jgi:hypothetical protein
LPPALAPLVQIDESRGLFLTQIYLLTVETGAGVGGSNVGGFVGAFVGGLVGTGVGLGVGKLVGFGVGGG